MLIELYANPGFQAVALPESPISSLNGELPDEETGLELGDLLGSFSSREEAIAAITQQVSEQNGQVTESHSAPFNDYSHVEWLTVTVQTANQQTESRAYYLVTDEGY
ncbi:hypothetical protein [Spirosoma oryzicola]|uniref:hypothetical protein n=1 Tax=Spirosoma oryzicola TaxID=2898794 RepID=UPI001E495BF3|nr:hypothetical protein [Spirosoma oryzicola]UHG89853.1 hypothetical protein LQ777_16555 [Spirosoma oryzicola]